MTQTSYQTAAWLSLRHAAENLESAALLLAPSRSIPLRRLRQQVDDVRAEVVELATRLDPEHHDDTTAASTATEAAADAG